MSTNAGQQLLNITHASSNTEIAGAEATGDDITLTSNTTDALPKIVLNALSSIDFDASTTYFRFMESGSARILISAQRNCIYVYETTTPTAIADYGALYTKNDNKLYFQSGDGVEHEVAYV